MDLVITLLIILSAAYLLNRYGDIIFEKKEDELSSSYEITEKLNDLQSELLQEKLTFKIVPQKVMYSKTFGIYFKYVSVMTGVAALCLLLDLLFHGEKSIYQNADNLQWDTLAYVFFTFIFFGCVIGNIAWKYHFFMNGLVNKIKNINVITDLISSYAEKITKLYFFVSFFSFLIGTVLFKSGYTGYIYSTILFGILMYLYLCMEISRIRFAPILNIITENLSLVQKVKNAK